MKILVVDDDRDILESTQMLFELSGHDVQCIDDADAVLDALRTFRPEAILQDVNMPRLDIHAMVAAQRRTAPTACIFLFTASADVDELRQTMDVDGVITKPFEPSETLTYIAQSLQEKKR